MALHSKTAATAQRVKQLDLRAVQKPGAALSPNVQLSGSPSSLAISPSAGIEDIKNASLYDLIKLQMINQ